MPELPEVEAARSAVADHCIGKKIVRAIIANDPKVIDGVSPSDFEASILNKTIVAAHRKGKNMWIQLDSPPFPTFQFGMTGAIYIKGVAVTKYKRSAVKDTDEWPSKFSKFFIELNDGLELSFTDKRRFARVRLLDDPPSAPPISELGPDALLEPMTEDEFFTALRKKKIAIKSLFLDQSFISGIGNWVADEVLYQARIHPLEIASSLSREDCARLLKCIKEVTWHAVEVDADSNRFPFVWLFHFRWGKKPGNVDGKKVDFINVGGRTTAYVPELQKLSGTQATKAPAKPRKQASKKNKDDEEDGSDDDGDAGKSDSEEEERGNVESKRKNSKGGGKNPPRRQKTTTIAEEGDSDDDDDKKMATAKRKSRGMGGNKNANKSKKSGSMAKKARTEAKPKENNDSDAGDDSDDYNGDQKSTRKAKGTKPQPKKRTSKKVK
uniref:Formamidopyrimidine-DNA glycosylase catalytic domain-containing protein n=1 Tax=Opuntia streptacantha TaxID=393608 RepID=A0A7C9DK63_OPUST